MDKLKTNATLLASVPENNMVDLALSSASAKSKKPRLPVSDYPYIAVQPSLEGDEYNLHRSSCDAMIVQHFDVSVSTASWRISDDIQTTDLLPIKWAVIKALYPLDGFRLVEEFSDGTQWLCLYRLEGARSHFTDDPELSKGSQGWSCVMVVRAELSIPRAYLGA
jgi:hypothetical protein